MKKTQVTKLVLGAVLFIAFAVSVSSCKAGCGCPKFQIEQSILE